MVLPPPPLNVSGLFWAISYYMRTLCPTLGPNARREIKIKNWLIVLTTLLIGLIAAHAQAVDTYWQGGIGNWSIGSNWDNGEPTASDDVYINNGGTAHITQAGEACGWLYLGQNVGQSGNVILSGSGYFDAYREFIGYVRYG